MNTLRPPLNFYYSDEEIDRFVSAYGDRLERLVGADPKNSAQQILIAIKDCRTANDCLHFCVAIYNTSPDEAEYLALKAFCYIGIQMLNRKRKLFGANPLDDWLQMLVDFAN